MKIVKFKNGKYGVREWSWHCLEFKFACPTGAMHLKTRNLIQEFNSLDKAKEVLYDCEREKERVSDNGSTVD